MSLCRKPGRLMFETKSLCAQCTAQILVHVVLRFNVTTEERHPRRSTF